MVRHPWGIPAIPRRFPSDLVVLFCGVGCFCFVVLVVFGRAPWVPTISFLISIRFGSVFGCFGCFCLLVLVFFGRSPLGHPLPFYLISIRFAGFWWFWWFWLFLIVLVVLVVFGRAPPWGTPFHFPLMSIRFGGVFKRFGCCCLVVLVVFGKAPLVHTLPFPLISIRFDGCGGVGCFCLFW